MSAPEGARSHRLSTWLQPDEHQALRRIAREQRITFSSMILGMFAMALGNSTGDRKFRLNVPLFWRHPLVNDVQRIVGDFVNLVILDVDLTITESLGALCQNLASQMLELLEHSAYSGVNLMRDLSRHHGSPQLSPVVFTAALDLPNGDLFSPRVQRAFGTMNWAISQGPQVALDAQIVSFEGGILINWDIRLDALPQEWVTKLFDRFVSSLKDAVDDPRIMARPMTLVPSLSQGTKVEQPLSPMQRAYLFGRTAQLPLGGVAMQEFREYRGIMDPALLRSRLTEMVRHYKSLRTLIDVEKLVQVVNDQELLNLQEVDLTDLSTQDALKQVKEYRDIYSHSIFDLRRSPWNITIYRFKDDLLHVFVRFDALILDGQSISALIVELFEGRLPTLQSFQNDSLNIEDLATSQKVDAAYWKDKLIEVNDTAQLPWSIPLAQLNTSRYERQSLTINSEVFEKVRRTGAKQGLFLNSTIMALILEVLSHWNARRSLCVAVPVMPLHAELFSSSSTFIAIRWDISHDSFAKRAAKLQSDVLEGLNHLSFSGVDLTRLLFENCGRSPVLPIVITNGLSWPSLSEMGPMKLCNGLTQTPQVAIDIRFVVAQDGSLVFDIDYARDAITSEVISSLLRDIQKAIKQLVENSIFSIDTLEFTRISNESKSSQTWTSSVLVRNKLLKIYLDALGKHDSYGLELTTDFTEIGLLPKHLKSIAARLRGDLSLEITPGQLLSCRNLMTSSSYSITALQDSS